MYNGSMKEKIERYITDHRDEMIATLIELIKMPSADGGDTLAQEVVKRKLEELGFACEAFQMDERVKDCPDYCEPDIAYAQNAYNVTGIRKSPGSNRTMMLYGHIDTEREDFFGDFSDPYEARIENGKIYGLGASDDKGGIAMILEALKSAYAINGDLGYDVRVLSILGKHGGAYGTLSAMMKGYAGDDSIYVHPAETGHGFREIKNISLGILDMKLTVFGQPGVPHDDLSIGVNANLILARAADILERYNKKKREEDVFDFGSFKGEPSFLLNIGSLSSKGSAGTICEKAECLFRVRFFFPDTIDLVFEEVKAVLEKELEGKWLLEKGNFRAQPAMVDNNDRFVKFIEENIGEVEGKHDFIHQYHGGSDVRFPILYGGGRCVGIGPYCELPVKRSGTMEWIDVEDYLKGIEILTLILLRYEKSC